MRKIYVVGDNTEYANWMEGEITNDMKEAYLVVFTGGEDVSPSLYGEHKHPSTYSDMSRDVYEMEMYEDAIQMGIPCIGICRGNQFLSVMNGASLIQHQLNPSYKHKMTTYDGKELIVTSSHHQAAFPFNLPTNKYKLLAWTENISPYHENSKQEEMNPPVEVEAIYFPKTRCLGIQGHPEWQLEDKETINWCRQLLNTLLNEQSDF